MVRTFKYKLKPNKAQRLSLSRTLDICRDLFNLSLEQRKMQRIHKFEQAKQLTQLKAAFPEFKEVHVHVLQNVLYKLHRSFENMWVRGAGFPRFKGSRRYNSFQFNNTGFALNGNQLSISKIGNVKLHLSRPIPKGGVIKTLTIKRTVSGWFAFLAVDVPAEPLPVSDEAVGIDFGIESFAAFPDARRVLTVDARQLSCCKRFTSAYRIDAWTGRTKRLTRSSRSTAPLFWKTSTSRD
jgi:putative transposase